MDDHHDQLLNDILDYADCFCVIYGRPCTCEERERE